jgi:uncharacterized protein with HEPN domain
MPRDYKTSLDDILEAVNRIETDTAGMDQARFQADSRSEPTTHPPGPAAGP